MVAAVSELNSIAVNDIGDVVLSDVDTIEALADPGRFRLFSHVQRNGPVHQAALREALGASDDVLGANLRQLADVGLVTPSPLGWTAPGRGLYVDAVAPGAEQALRRLYEVMILDTTDLPVLWVRDQAGRLGDDWFRASGMFNARVRVTRYELDDLQVKLEELLAPYLSRREAPAGVKEVRVLAYFMTDPA